MPSNPAAVRKIIALMFNTCHKVPNHAITKSGQVSNYATKKSASEYPKAGSLLRPRKTHWPCVQLSGENAGLLESEVGSTTTAITAIIPTA